MITSHEQNYMTSIVGSEYSGKNYPDGSITIGRRPVSSAKPLYRHSDTTEEAFAKQSCRVHGVLPTLHVVGQLSGRPNLVQELQEMGRVTPLVYPGCSSLTKSTKPSAPKGSGGLTKHGARLLRFGVEELERRVGKGNVGFGTLTLPEITDDEMLIVCEHWSELIRQVNQWLTRQLTKSSALDWVIGVTENQSKRSIAQSRFVPHYHFVFQCRVARKFILTPQELRKAWLRLLGRLLKKRLTCSQNLAIENLQVMRRSVGRYLAKYLSKGKRSASSELPDRFPGEEKIKAWYSVSLALRQLYRKRIRRFSNECYKVLVDLIDRGVDVPGVKMGCIRIDKGTHKVAVGWYILPLRRLPREIASLVESIDGVAPNVGY